MVKSPPVETLVRADLAEGAWTIIETMRYLDLTLPTIEANLALDEALLIEAEERSGGSALRIWEPEQLAVVLGSSCRLAEDVHVDRCRAERVAIARRTSGGGTVLIGPGTLNVTVVLDSHAAPGLGAVDVAQRFVLDRIAGSLGRLEPAVEVQGLGDLTLGPRKFSGSAQRRLRQYFLVHLTILYDFPLPLISRYTALPRRQPAYRAGRSHEDFLTNLHVPREALIEAVCSAWGELRSDGVPAGYPEALVDELVRTKFADKAWIERL